MGVVVIGCGEWGKNLVRNFDALGALAAVCEAHPSGRATARAVAPGAQVVEDLEVALGLGLPVVIATPAETHFRIARRALESGLDVFVEKPLSLTFDEGAELVRLAREHDRILMVGHVLEYHPAVRRLLELVRSGALGPLYYIYSNRLSLGKVRREENILWSFAPHDIAVILRLVGAAPIAVSAAGGAYLQPHVADVTITTMLFGTGVRAHIHVSWLHPYKEQRLIVIGANGMAAFDDVSKRLEMFDRRVEFDAGQPVPIRGESSLIAFDQTEPLRLECEAFLEAVATRRPPLTDGTSGLAVLAVLQAAQSSLAQAGTVVSLAESGALRERGA